MSNLTYSKGACWKNGKLQLNIEDRIVHTRRLRATEVVRDYSHVITEKGVTFSISGRKIYVELCEDSVGCSCPDIENRQLPCKHVFAAAVLWGDDDAIATHSDPFTPATPAAPPVELKRRWHGNKIRPQDVRLGQYFLLSDFVYSESATRNGVANLPPSFDCPEVEGMRGLCQHVLDPLVNEFGPLSIAFGYISDKLWEFWNGPQTSPPRRLHTFRPPQGGCGGAVDVLVHSRPNPEQAREILWWIKDNCSGVDRVILYPGSAILCVAWCAVSPRYHFKEWVFYKGAKGASYINARPIVNLSQASLFDLI